MKNAAEAENVLLGVYRDMVQDGIYGFHLSLYFTIPSDIAKVTGNSTDGLRLIPSNAYTSAQSQKIGTADIPVIFWLEIFHHGKNIMNSFILNCRDQ